MHSSERQKIVEQARSYLGVRWRHQGRARKTGIDCAGLVICVGWDLGYLDRSFDVQGYRREPDGRTLADILTANTVQKNISEWEPGDIVLLRDISTHWPCHMGFLSERKGSEDPNLIHCWARLHRKCVEVRFDENWSSRLTGIYAFKGVE